MNEQEQKYNQYHVLNMESRQKAIESLAKINAQRAGKKFKLVRVNAKTWVEKEVK